MILVALMRRRAPECASQRSTWHTKRVELLYEIASSSVADLRREAGKIFIPVSRLPLSIPQVVRLVLARPLSRGIIARYIGNTMAICVPSSFVDGVLSGKFLMHWIMFAIARDGIFRSTSSHIIRAWSGRHLVRPLSGRAQSQHGGCAPGDPTLRPSSAVNTNQIQ